MMQGWWGERPLSLLGGGPNCGESATCPRIILRIDAARSAGTAATRKKLLPSFLSAGNLRFADRIADIIRSCLKESKANRESQARFTLVRVPRKGHTQGRAHGPLYPAGCPHSRCGRRLQGAGCAGPRLGAATAAAAQF